MTLPALKSFANQLYGALVPMEWNEATQNYALANYVGGIGEMFQIVDDLGRDQVVAGKFSPGWSQVMDINRCPSYGLGWLAQFVGVTLQTGLTDAQQRQRIKSTDGWFRGTPAAMAAAAQQYLVGTKSVTMRERDPAASPSWPAYGLTVYTRASETLGAGIAGTALTASGNEITDATRLANTQGDGLLTPNGFGIWEATTNLVTNGGLETNTTGWSPQQGPETISRSTSFFKFGAASLSVTTPGSTTDEGTNAGGAGQITIASSTVYSFSLWALIPNGVTLKWGLDWYTAAPAYISTSFGTNVVGTGTWQRITMTATSPGTALRARPFVRTVATVAMTFYLDGIQVEQKAYSTPYVETNGATATRNAGLVTTPSAVLVNSSQGYMMAAVKMGYGSGDGVGALIAPGPLTLSDGTNNNRIGMYNTGTTTWQTRRVSGGAGGSVAQVNVTWNRGDILFLALKWDAANIYISVNGAAWTSVANSGTFSPTTLTFGGGGAVGNYLDGQILWAACGNSSPSNTQLLNTYTKVALGYPYPVWDDMITLGMSPTGVFPMVTTANTQQGTSSPQVLAALIAQKPAGIILRYIVLAGQDYQNLFALHSPYSSVFSTYLTYQGVVLDAPGT